jgi:uncharacterized membrane protein YdjX (TVP38/TMEM64 family)
MSEEAEVREDPADVAAPPKRGYLRIAIAIALAIGLYVVARVTGVLENLDVAAMQRTVNDAGAWGFAVFVALFAVGTLLHVPGMVFVAAGMLIYGKLTGYFACLVGANVAVCASFVMVRAVGGRALTTIERPFVKRMLARLDKDPLRWLIVLRAICFISPPLNYTLALSSVRFRDYAIGSAIGLAPTMALMTFLFDWLFNNPTINAWLFR